MHSDRAYLRRIFQMPQPDRALQDDLSATYGQLFDVLPEEDHGLVLALIKKQSSIQREYCIRSFMQGYDLAVGIEWHTMP